MWRYKVVLMKAPGGEERDAIACEAKLNELGSEGWEVVAVMEQSRDWFVLLKMPHEVGTF